jgi:hypothetical protein
VTRVDDELLDEHPIVAERGLRFGLRRAKPSATSLAECAMRMPLPPPPAEALIITG